jgi:heme oxygenase
MTEASHEAVIDGALAAYGRFGDLLQRHFGVRE